jgi:hypothetical protein
MCNKDTIKDPASDDMEETKNHRGSTISFPFPSLMAGPYSNCIHCLYRLSNMNEECHEDNRNQKNRDNDKNE